MQAHTFYYFYVIFQNGMHGAPTNWKAVDHKNNRFCTWQTLFWTLQVNNLTFKPPHFLRNFFFVNLINFKLIPFFLSSFSFPIYYWINNTLDFFRSFSFSAELLNSLWSTGQAGTQIIRLILKVSHRTLIRWTN